MNKPIVFLLVGISSLFTFIASGSNSSSESSKGKYAVGYRRVVVLIEDGKSLTWMEKDPFGKPVAGVIFRPLGDGAEIRFQAGKTLVERTKYEDTSEAFDRSKELLEAYLDGVSNEYEVFQVDVETTQEDLLGILSTGRQETLHYRSKSQ